MLAKEPFRADSFRFVTVVPFDSCLMRSCAIVESVERANCCAIFAPGIRRSVIRICSKFGMFAAVVLDLGGDVAIVIGLDELIDAACKPFRPLVFDQGSGIGDTGALDIRKVEFANIAEDPVS